MQKKSKPTGIRFDLLKERAAFNKSGLSTRQSLVDYLLDSYVRGDIHAGNEIRAAVLGDIPRALPKIVRSYDYYATLKRECESPEYWEPLKAEILASELTPKQKQLLTS